MAIANTNRAIIASYAEPRYRKVILAATLDDAAGIMTRSMGAPNRAEAREAARWIRAGNVHMAKQGRPWLD